jgi:hypothetical protein
LDPTYDIDLEAVKAEDIVPSEDAMDVIANLG